MAVVRVVIDIVVDDQPALDVDDALESAVIVAAFAVVAFSIFAQGLTMPWLIRVLGLTRKIEPVA